MDHLHRLHNQTRVFLFGMFLATTLFTVAAWWFGTVVLHLNGALVPVVSVAMGAGLSVGMSEIATAYLLEPMRVLWQAILHVSPAHGGTPAPDLDKSQKLGRELVTSLVLQVYQLASTTEAQSTPPSTAADLRTKTIANNLPLPLLVMDKSQLIIFANDAAQKYLRTGANDLIGKNMYSVLDLAFPTTRTFDSWLRDVRATKAVASESWERVRLKLPDAQTTLQFDMSASYSKDSSSGIETMVALFDHTDSYDQEDEGLNFIAIAVHELRTPITLLRGYIEVFGDELKDNLTPELDGFMSKMESSAQQLSAFVNNILNVARVEANQLTLRLNEENWPDIVKSVGNDLDLRAQVQNKTIEYEMAPKLPTVGVDRVSIYEVLSNLLDNAIKYSTGGQKILVKSYLTKDGTVETTVQDWGMGITESVVPNLFERFYRNHRTQAQVGGTGLGLYLSKAIIEAHGGHIWIRSKEGQGTTVGFTIQPYALVAGKLKSSDNNTGIVRQAHGWIKNHSMYRR
jgi:two-component system sensor histidine kinase VicK